MLDANGQLFFFKEKVIFTAGCWDPLAETNGLQFVL